MKKEKHPVYRLVMAGLIALLVTGILMFLSAVLMGENWIMPGPVKPL